VEVYDDELGINGGGGHGHGHDRGGGGDIKTVLK
jgi:hypothetical protein